MSELSTRAEIVCYPAYGWPDEGGRWKIRVRGVVLRPSASRWRRRLMTRVLRRKLAAQLEPREERLLGERILPFARRGVENLALSMDVGPFRADLPRRTDREGHFSAELSAPGPFGDDIAVDSNLTRRVALRISLQHDKDVNGEGEALLIPEQGTSVVSDIDDTIKSTEMADRQLMLRNTFVREFRQVEGMAAAYHRWQHSGTSFHYVSLSPRPLYRPLFEFLASAGFPWGTLHLRAFRFRNQILQRVLSDRSAHKDREIRRLLRAFPSRSFVLVGDDADRDPELYSSIVQDHANQVSAIYLRTTRNEGRSAVQLRMTGAARPRTRIFKRAVELPDQL